MKGVLYAQFENQYYQAEAEEAIANIICSHLDQPIRTQVRENIGKKMVALMKSVDPLFSTKMSLKVKILSDLLDEDNFEEYMIYIKDVKKSILKWLRHYTVKFCDEKVDGGTRLQNASKEEVTRLILVIESLLNDLSMPDIESWLNTFCNNSTFKGELGVYLQADDLLAGYGKLKLNLENFKRYFREGLKRVEGEIQSSFSDIYCELEIGVWREKPDDLLKYLIGCTEQCPFCGEQCDMQDPNHYPGLRHSTAVHRLSCLRGFLNTESRIMSSDFCPAHVSSSAKFRNSHTNGAFRPYKDYHSIYPEWFINKDPSSSDSLYWKRFAGKYMNEIAREFQGRLHLI